MKSLLLSLFLALSSITSYAQQDKELFALPIESTNPTRQELQSALFKVINRITAELFDSENPVYLEANPEQLIQSRRVQNHHGQKQLLIQFDPELVIQLMNKASVQPWFKNRPKIKAVLVLANESSSKVINGNSNSDLIKTLRQAAIDKGINLEFLTIDDERLKSTLTQKHTYTIRQKMNALIDFTKKNTPEALWIIQLDSDDNISYRYAEHFLYYKKNEGSAAKYREAKLQELAPFIMATGAEFLFNQGEKIPPKETEIWVSIDGITTVAAFKGVDAYLKKIPGVIHLKLNSVTQTAVLYTLELNVSPDVIDKRLARKYTALPANGTEDILKYRIHT